MAEEHDVGEDNSIKVEKLLYDKKSAASALSISSRSVDYYIAARILRTRRVGRRVMIPASEL